ncbi:MAG: NUDIX hydrolase [Chloroflexi bacterium]|nr:MAG: NUDIX hydrolase [Chloroflexota bacterium]
MPSIACDPATSCRSSSRSTRSTCSTRRAGCRSERSGKRPPPPDTQPTHFLPPLLRPDVGVTDERSTDHLRERVVASRVLHRGHYLTFRIDTIERADGTRRERDVCGHPGAVAIVALDDQERVLLVRQWRSPAGRAMLEIPAGTLDIDRETEAVEDRALAAPRELEEETGYRAERWRLIGSFWTAPGFATELMHLYLATDLRPAHEGRLGPDEDERLELERWPWRDAVDAVERGDIIDAKSIVGLFWLARLKESGQA